MSGKYDYQYPEAICMMCRKECSVWEIVDVSMGEWELWCYCKECDVETFHPPLNKKEEEF